MTTETKGETLTLNIIKKAKDEIKSSTSKSKQLQSALEKEEDVKSPDMNTYDSAFGQNIIEEANDEVKTAPIENKQTKEIPIDLSDDVTPTSIKTSGIGKEKSPSKVQSISQKMKTGISRLMGLGFQKKEKSVEEIEDKEKPKGSQNIFKETFDQYPLARVSGSKTPASYNLTKDRKQAPSDPDIEKDPSILLQTFDPKKSAYTPKKEPATVPSEYPKKDPIKQTSIVSDDGEVRSRMSPSSLESVDPKVRFRDSSLVDVAGSSTVIDPELKSRNKITQESMKKSIAPFIDRMDTIAPSVSAKEEDIYTKSSKQLPDISRKVPVVTGALEESCHQDLTIGKEGFVAQLLLDFLGETRPTIESRKHKPSLEECKQIAQAANLELKSYFTESSRWKSRKKKEKSPLRKLKSQQIAEVEPKPSTSKVQDETSLDSKIAHLKTEWQPGSLENLEKQSEVGLHRREKAWVGSYVVGTDYWTKKEATTIEQPEKVAFTMDKKQRPWYDLPTSESSLSMSSMENVPSVTREKLDAMKVKLPETEVGIIGTGRKLRDKFDEGALLPENWNEDLQNMFNEFTKGDNLVATKNRLSLAKADKWLEMVGILDYKDLSVINTGLCFKAAGGSRYRGLTFTEFKTFLELIAETKKMPFQDIVSRLKLVYMGIIVP